MLAKDEKLLDDLLSNYSIKDIIEVLSELSIERSCEMVDLELSDNAKIWSSNAIILNEMSTLLK